MKVLCVDSSARSHSKDVDKGFQLTEGEYYHVVDEKRGRYELFENLGYLYDKDRFIITSDKDERVIVNMDELILN